MPDHHLQEAFQGKEARHLDLSHSPMVAEEAEVQELLNPMAEVVQDSI